MMGNIVAVLSGAIAMAGIVAALFFLKFWRRTKDPLFLFFAAAFAIDALGRFVLAIVQVSDTTEPMYFLPRLVMFTLIALAIMRKNARRP